MKKNNLEFEGWREYYKDKEIKITELTKIIKPGQRIFIGTGCSEPQSLTTELIKKQSEITDCEIIHFLTSGKNKFFSEYSPSRFRHNALFIGETMRKAVAEGWADYTPIRLSDIPKLFISGRKDIDVVLVQITPPNKHGKVSLGINVDINKIAVHSASTVIAQINPQMPFTLGDSLIDFSEIDKWIYKDEPIIECLYEEPDEIAERIGKNISKLVENGSTIQTGIGQIPNAVIKFLVGKKDLTIFTEVFSDGVINLVNSGAINTNLTDKKKPKIITSFVTGSRSFYDWINNNPLVEFRTTEYINNPFNIAKNEKLVSINSALTIDLTGQVNSDSIGTQFYSGIGGQIDFIRGSALSYRGKPIVALPSTTSDGKKSRIVPVLEEGAGVVINRGDVHYVITEYGHVFLHGKTIRERVLQLIGIAHPKFRKELLEKAKQLNYIYKDQMLPKNIDGVVVVYPEAYESEFISANGEKIFIRPIKFTDERMLQELYYSLSNKDRRLRFFTVMKTFSHKIIQPRVNLDYETQMGLVALEGEEPNGKIIAGAAYYLDRATNTAEISLTVHEKFRKQKIGRHLLETLIKVAREKRVSGFTGDFLYENSPIFHLLQTLGYKIEFNRSISGEKSFTLFFNNKIKIKKT
ncbi:MAG: GNAT family N-acetyltransferase [Promethearchaeota archaeon]